MKYSFVIGLQLGKQNVMEISKHENITIDKMEFWESK